MQLGSIHIYPVKGGRGVDRETAAVEAAGLAGDRRWMVVDAAGRFVTQRELPKLALLDAQLDPDGLHLGYETAGERFVPTPDGAARLTVRVWDDTVEAALADAATNAALSRWLGQDVRLVYQDGGAARTVSTDWSTPDRPVSFADGFPLLVANRQSLRALNTAIVSAGGGAVPMSRFRPNIVIEDAEPFAEDGWATIRIGAVVLDLVKPCARCTVTTVDQQTGRVAGTEPLDALRRLRMSADRRVPGVLFGWNAVPRSPGRIDVGDLVRVEAHRPPEGIVRPPRQG
ncbi:MOSC domain-containing protein [Jiella sp. M17.18]|uniref:MOSC domain-containing protein n=1 Tax=Jiella sp. M17.18 TaxID=3234247 RepID=UPI0034DEE957